MFDDYDDYDDYDRPEDSTDYDEDLTEQSHYGHYRPQPHFSVNPRRLSEPPEVPEVPRRRSIWHHIRGFLIFNLIADLFSSRRRRR